MRISTLTEGRGRGQTDSGGSLPGDAPGRWRRGRGRAGAVKDGQLLYNSRGEGFVMHPVGQLKTFASLLADEVYHTVLLPAAPPRRPAGRSPPSALRHGLSVGAHRLPDHLPDRHHHLADLGRPAQDVRGRHLSGRPDRDRHDQGAGPPDGRHHAGRQDRGFDHGRDRDHEPHGRDRRPDHHGGGAGPVPDGAPAASPSPWPCPFWSRWPISSASPAEPSWPGRPWASRSTPFCARS